MLRIMSTTLRFILASLVVLGVGFYALVDHLGKRVERQYLEAEEEPMVDAAHLVAALVEGTLKPDNSVDVDLLRRAWTGMPTREVKAQIYDIVKTSVDMNVYVVDASGRCVFDSRGEVEGQDLSMRRDVGLTLAGVYGARSTREDEKDDRTSVMYVGAPVRKDGRIVAAVSVIKPQRSMFEFIKGTHREISGAGWTMFGLVGGGVVVLSWWLLRPLRKLRIYAQRLSEGERAEAPPLAGSEAVALGKAFENMRDALEDRQYVETYIQGLTHEIKSPLAAIRGAVELSLEKDISVEDRQRFLGNIQVESQRMQRIIDRLLVLSQIEARKSLERKEKVVLGEVVRSVCEAMAESFRQRGVTLEVEIKSDASVRGDAMLLEMALDNLLQNALDFSPSGTKARVEVTLEAGEMVIRVLDQGVGIPDYAEARVFERFYSLQRPRTAKKSSGLGLCFVKEAAELHGGRAVIKNRAGESGVCAEIWLPRAEI
jgi:two-component system, OmpR family, sensor histidine kinase CreC